MKINEVDPRNYDSDIDYYNALNAKPKQRTVGEPRLSPRQQDAEDEDAISQQRQAAAAKARKERETTWDNKQEGSAPNGQQYNSVYTINAPSKASADSEAYSFKDYHWGAKKVVDQEYSDLGDGRIELKLYVVDNHKYGLWRPWKDSPVYKEGVSEAEEDAFVSKLGGLKSWQVVIRNNYYNGKYSDYSGRYFYVLATSAEEAKQVVLDNADDILQDLLALKSHNGKKILPRGSAVRITPDRIGKIEDGTVAGRMSTTSYRKMYSPQGVMMVKLTIGAISDVQGQEQGVAEGDPGYNKHSFIGKIRRSREADNKGWGQLGQQFAANSEEEYRKALRKGNRYYNMTRGDNKTPGGFPKTTVEQQGVAEGYDDEEHPIQDDGNEGRPGKQRYPGKLKTKGVAEGGFKNLYAEFSGYGNYMQGRAVNVFNKFGLEIVSKEYTEDDDIQTYVVKGDRWAIEKVGKFLERNPEQFGGYHFVKQGVAEGLSFNDKRGKWEWDDGTRVSPDELTPAQKERLQQWKAANPGKRPGRASVPDTREPAKGFGGRVFEKGMAEGAGNISNSIKALYQKIYDAGDDEIEYFYNDSPIFAQYWDEYEGDLDSIIAEVDPKELQIMHDELESYVQQANLAEGFKNSYSVGDRVDSPMGTGTVVALSKNIDIDDKVKVKLDDPSKAGEDGKYKDTFVLTTAMLKHLPEESSKAKNPYAIGMAQAMKSTGDKPPLEKATIRKAHEIAKRVMKQD